MVEGVVSIRYPDDFINRIICGDCLEVIKQIPDNSIDSIVTDPPAGIAFMGSDWDSFTSIKNTKSQVISWMNAGVKFSSEGLFEFQEFIYQVFSEAIRVLKPGGHILVWALPRTSHHTAMGIERAGFEIRDKVYYIFGTGFPKSYNIGKAVDKLQDNPREIINEQERDGRSGGILGKKTRVTRQVTIGNSQWEGWGTSLKPAVEEWILARKPLSEKSITENVLRWGTGGLNIDACRIPLQDGENLAVNREGDRKLDTNNQGWGFKAVSRGNEGRFPAHLILDGSEEVENLFPITKSGQLKKGHKRGNTSVNYTTGGGIVYKDYGGDKGSAARFFKHCSITEEDLKYSRIFYGSKANKKEKGKGNNHPTVKSLSLMKYLCRLITPSGGIVLDMFAGSGTTLIAAKQEGFNFIGIEKEPRYCRIAEERLKNLIQE